MKHRIGSKVGLLLLIGWLCAGAANAATGADAGALPRHLNVIVDTSASMRGNDPRRYTLQLARILTDLLDQQDSLTVIRMPRGERSCSEGADESLARRLQAADRAGFKQALDPLLEFDTGTYFAAAIHTAVADLRRRPEAARMLLIIADAGGLGACQDALTRELLQLRDDGVLIAAINLGGSRGAFDGNPAFAFTAAALDAQALVQAVAEVYQKFLGTKQVQTGRVQDTIAVDIAPFVQEAFLVVAADGPLTGLEEAEGNPGAEQTDLNHRGGGVTVGLDRRGREYRIIRLQRPAPGRWHFRVHGLQDTAGWMLVQDSAVGLRLLSPPNLATGQATVVEVELIDRVTGQRIIDTSPLPGLSVTLTGDGQTVSFRDDGSDGDRQAGDGILSGRVTFDQPGRQRAALHLESDLLERRLPVEFEVVRYAWLSRVTTPPRAEVQSPVLLGVQLEPNNGATGLEPVRQVEVTVDGRRVATLRDDGRNGDRQAGDRLFSGPWMPAQTGQFELSYTPVGGGVVQPAQAPLDVIGRVEFGPPVPLRLGPLDSGGEAQASLDLSSATVKGDVSLEVSSDYGAGGSVLEIDLGQGWIPLDATVKPLLLQQIGRRSWPVRLRVGDCPGRVDADTRFSIVLTGSGADGQPLRTAIPLTMTVIPDPWLHCWWPLLALLAGLAALAVLIHGFWSPSRFPPRLGVVISPEADMSEGFFHPVRAQRGSGSGFYRDARIYLGQDYRLSNRTRGALARLRAAGRQIRIEPASGTPLQRQRLDGEWEPVPADETWMRFGTVYRDELGTVYFELRNG